MCTLRAYGKVFDVDHFLKKWPLRASGVFHRGEMRGKRKIVVNSFNMGLSNASWTDLAAQVRDATTFIQKYGKQLNRLRRYSGIEGVCLDFPVESRLSSKIFMQEEHFPEKFVRLVGKFGLAVNLSIYPKSRDRMDPR